MRKLCFQPTLVRCSKLQSITEQVKKIIKIPHKMDFHPFQPFYLILFIYVFKNNQGEDLSSPEIEFPKDLYFDEYGNKLDGGS